MTAAAIVAGAIASACVLSTWSSSHRLDAALLVGEAGAAEGLRFPGRYLQLLCDLKRALEGQAVRFQQQSIADPLGPAPLDELVTDELRLESSEVALRCLFAERSNEGPHALSLALCASAKQVSRAYDAATWLEHLF